MPTAASMPDTHVAAPRDLADWPGELGSRGGEDGNQGSVHQLAGGGEGGLLLGWEGGCVGGGEGGGGMGRED